MNKQELIKAMAEAAEISQATANKALDAFFDAITATLKKGDEIRLVGYLTMSKKHVAAKVVRNPRDGSPVKVPARNRVKAVIGKKLIDAIN